MQEIELKYSLENFRDYNSVLSSLKDLSSDEKLLNLYLDTSGGILKALGCSIRLRIKKAGGDTFYILSSKTGIQRKDNLFISQENEKIITDLEAKDILCRENDIDHLLKILGHDDINIPDKGIKIESYCATIRKEFSFSGIIIVLDSIRYPDEITEYEVECENSDHIKAERIITGLFKRLKVSYFYQSKTKRERAFLHRNPGYGSYGDEIFSITEEFLNG